MVLSLLLRFFQVIFNYSIFCFISCLSGLGDRVESDPHDCLAALMLGNELIFVSILTVRAALAVGAFDRWMREGFMIDQSITWLFQTPVNPVRRRRAAADDDDVLHYAVAVGDKSSI